MSTHIFHYTSSRDARPLWLSLTIWLVALTSYGCGGNHVVLPPTPDTDTFGIRFSSKNPHTVAAGETVDLLIEARPLDNSEANGQTWLTATPQGGAAIEGASSWAELLGPIHTKTYYSVKLKIPAGAPAGSQFQVGIVRTATAEATPPQYSDSWTVTTGPSVVRGTFSPAIASGLPGQTVTSSLNLQASPGTTGTVAFQEQLPGVSVNPSSIDLPAVDPTLSVSYQIPASTPRGATLRIPVFFRTPGDSGFTMLNVQAGEKSGDFQMTVSPGSAFVTLTDDSAPITVTLTPQGGFTGNVTVTVTFTSNRFIVPWPYQNPFILKIADESPVNSTFRIHMSRLSGSAAWSRGSIGSATVTATGGGHTHSETIAIDTEHF